MDNSLNSDIFDDECIDEDNHSESEPSKVKAFYESILATTKSSFITYENEVHKITFPTYLATILEDSWSCITCALEDLIKGLLTESTVNIHRIVEYLEDSIYLLRMLSDLYKSMVNSVSISCCSMKTLPKQTGLIILSVFGHCKDSENIYGEHLKSVEKQLKDLFRICHELQLMYLQILEKHFVFNFNNVEEKTIISEAFQINLSIGKVVHSLDVKTMAEQWKAYTSLCEKYATYIADTDVFVDCSQVLGDLVRENIEIAIKPQEDEKVIVRSLKVASFTIKILAKICNIFRESSTKNYSCIIELLQYININYVSLEKSSTTLVTLMNSNLVFPSESLLKELLLDEDFVVCLVNSVSSNNWDDKKTDENILGLILLITSAMKCAIQGTRQAGLKIKLVSSIYSLLPYSYALHYQRIIENHSQFEHLLTNTAALALTMTNEEFNALEKNMVEAILSTECVTALFSSHLWAILANFISPQLLFNQLIWLCTMYKKLDSRKHFNRSPHNIHLSYTLSRLFKVMDDENKLKFCKQFRIHDEDNMTLWTALRIRSLPLESQMHVEGVVEEKLREISLNLSETDSPDLLIRIINLAATCTFKTSRSIDDQLVIAWSRACQQNQTVSGLYKNSVWFYDYVRSLVALTDSLLNRLKERSENIVKILHVITGLTKTGDDDMKLILTGILCKLATCEVTEHKNIIEYHFNDAFTSLLQNSDVIVTTNLRRTLKTYKNTYLDNIVTNGVKDSGLEETWQSKEDVLLGNHCKYVHKCFNNRVDEMEVHELKEANLDDFYFDSGGSDMLTEIDEPCSKRGKPNSHEVDVIIRKLEEYASLLVSQTYYTPEQVKRIQNVCQNLKNISN